MLGRCSSTWAQGGRLPLLQLSICTLLPRLLRSSLLLPRTHLATPPHPSCACSPLLAPLAAGVQHRVVVHLVDGHNQLGHA